jgi:hypothetical protein
VFEHLSDSIQKGVFHQNPFVSKNDLLFPDGSVFQGMANNGPAVDDYAGHFLQTHSVNIEPVLRNTGYTEWMVLFFFGVLFVLVTIWYFFPERLLKLIYNENSKIVRKLGSSQFSSPGILIYLLVTIIFISSTSATIYFTLKYFFGEELFHGASVPQILTFLGGVVLIYYLTRGLIIFLTGFIFNTVEISKKVMRSFLRADVVQGLLLIPVLFFIYFSSIGISIYIAIGLIALVTLYKWSRIFFIGMSSSNVSVFHNILYLCTLEIIPVYVLMKALSFYQALG